MTCQRIGRPPISTSALGMAWECSWRRVPRPPQRMTPGTGMRRGMIPGPACRYGAPMAVDPSIFNAYDVRGLYGEQIDAEVAEQLGRAFVRVLAELRGKPQGELRIGLGRDMRLTAPELAARYRDGMVSEGAHVLDAGQVGTEMLYFLVGSRDLDGGLMCTASHNPKAYTGAKLVRARALPLSGDEGIHDIRRAIEAGLGAPNGRAGSSEDVDVTADFHAA